MFSYYFEKKKFDTQVGFFREGQELARTMAFSQNELFSMSKDLCEESFNSLAKSFIELKNKKIILIKVLSQNLKKVDELFRTKVSKMYAVEDEMDELDELKTALESAESKVTFDLFKAETTLNNDKISNFDKEKLKIKITYIKDKLTESTCLIRRDRKEILIKMATRLMAKLEGK
jgi:DNA repair ATPase RecN